jgi:hypothetical protein
MGAQPHHGGPTPSWGPNPIPIKIEIEKSDEFGITKSFSNILY